MKMGLDQGAPPETWNLRYPDRIRSVHRGYIEAGAQIILTNTFGGTHFRLKLHNLQDQVHEVNLIATQLARAEADTAMAAGGPPVVIAGSIGPSGEILEPLGDCSFAEAKAGFAQQAAALTEGGADVLWLETMSDLNEVAAAVEGARSASHLPVAITMTFDTNGHTMMGVSPSYAAQILKDYNPIAIGGNCGNGVAELEGAIQGMYAVDQTIPLVAKSNAGIPQWIDGREVYTAGPSEMAEYAVRVRNMGAKIIGACCGSTADHIRMMGQALRQAPIEPIAIVAEVPDNGPARRNRSSRRRSRLER